MFLHGPAAEAEARSLIAKNGCGMSKNYWMNRRSASTFITIAYLCMLPKLIMDGVSGIKGYSTPDSCILSEVELVPRQLYNVIGCSVGTDMSTPTLQVLS